MRHKDEATYNAAKAAAARAPMGAKSGPAPQPLAPPTLKGINYNGVTQGVSGGAYPPDTHGAVGASNYVEIVNQIIAIYNKASPTPTLLTTYTLNAFFGYTPTALFDPRVVYDLTWKRWVISAEAFPESSGTQCHFLAASLTSNPAGSWYKYTICGVDFGGGFWDFPRLGMDQDAVIVIANWFAPGGGADSRMFAVAKAVLYNGLGFSVPVFALAFSAAPPIVLDGNKYAYFAAADVYDNSANVYLYRGEDLSNGWGATLVFQGFVPVGSYSVPPNAPQPATTQVIDTSDARFVNASTQVGDSLWNVNTIYLAGYAAPKFYEINTGTTALKQSAFFFEGSTSWDWNASIAANAFGSGAGGTIGDAFVTWSSTDVGSSPHQPRVRFGGRTAGDALGSMGAPGTSLFTSPVPLTANFDSNFGAQRWGDYSAVTLDPAAYGTCAATRRAWIVNEKVESGGTWGSRIGRIGPC